MKKIFSIFLTSLMIVSLAACGNSSQSAGANSTNETGTEADTETKVQTNAQDSAEASASEDSAGTAASQEEPAASGKTLVVYYSASGNTGRVAELVADELGADTFEIIPAEVYSDEDLDWTNRDSRVCKEHDDPSLQDIELVSTEVPGWNEYDVVLFGYPIWWREASWVVNNFITSNDFTGKTVIPFCTSTSSGLGDSGTNLEKMAGTGNWLEGMRFNENPDENSVREWVRGLDLE